MIHECRNKRKSLIKCPITAEETTDNTITIVTFNYVIWLQNSGYNLTMKQTKLDLEVWTTTLLTKLIILDIPSSHIPQLKSNSANPSTDFLCSKRKAELRSYHCNHQNFLTFEIHMVHQLHSNQTKKKDGSTLKTRSMWHIAYRNESLSEY